MSTPDKEKNAPQGPKKSKFNFSLYWIYGLAILVFIAINFMGSMEQTLPKTQVNTLFSWMDKGYVKRIQLQEGPSSRLEVILHKDSILAHRSEFAELIKNENPDFIEKGPHFSIDQVSKDFFEKQMVTLQEKSPNAQKVDYTQIPQNTMWREVLGWVVPIGLMVVFWIFIMRRMGGGAGGGQIFNIGKSKAKLFDKDTNVLVNFDSVAGLDEAKVELMEIVDFLKNPKKYTQLGAKIPKGALLVGPPGTGKTLLAKAVAGEAKVPFFSMSGSDFVEMFVGVGASRVRDLFKQAKEKAPVIVFIDEIDAIGRARGRSAVQGANDERENTLNQLLTEMDGFESNAGIIMLAATNRADILDKALLRPGRFDRQISVDLPDLNGREAIFKVHMKDKKLDASIDIGLLARQTPGFSGADIANICNEAALIAARKDKKSISREDFNDAIDRVVGGLEKKNKVISPQEKEAIAYHEAGHATVSWMLRYASPLVKVTIIPRGQSLGAAWYLPEERQITTTEQLMDEMAAALGGRAAEFVVYGKISTGALSDLEKVTKQAYAMISVYGLNDKIGNVSYYDSSGQSDYTFSKPYSEKTAEIIDEEVKKLIDSAYKRSIDLLLEHREKLDELAQRLLEREVLYREDLEELFGIRAFENQADATAALVSKASQFKPVASNTETSDATAPLNEPIPPTLFPDSSNPDSEDKPDQAEK
jgi:cell division protease FtsH